MSEVEKKKRYDYKQNRKKWIMIQAIAVLLVAVLGIAMFFTYSRLNKTYYINYTENGAADYTVILKNNEFFESNQLDSGDGYVSEMIDDVAATFKYCMQMEAVNVNFEHSHSVEARVEVVDSHSDAVLYQPSELLLDKAATVQSGDSVKITETVTVDFAKYERMAKKFIDTYGLTNTESRLVLTMKVHIEGQSGEFETNAENSHWTSLVIPLCEKTLCIETLSSAAPNTTHTLACKRDVNPNIFKVLGIICAVLCVIGGGVLTAYVFMTRNDDINYEIKVKRLLNAYRSYIQVITNSFDSSGYQLLRVESFNEMLGIRDTIQSPILMNENEDKTRTLFLIPTNTKVLYVFEIKVDDYDKLYPEEAVLA